MNKARDQHFERFEPHTLLKHLVLRSYLQAWAMKLLGDPKRTIWFVDAFAGEGRDAQGNPGSPLIAADIARQVLTERGQRQGRAPMRVLAIEENRQRFQRLEQVLSEHIRSTPRLVYRRCTTLEQIIDPFLGHVDDDPVLFFLDPFGLKGIVLEMLRKALSGPRNEIFALFSDMGAVRLRATLFTEGRDLDVELAQLAEAPSLFPEFDEEDAESRRKEVERSTQALQSTQRAAREILSEALGEDAAEDAAGLSAAEQAERLTRLFMRRLTEAGANHVLRLPVRDRRNAQVYQLVYATKSAAGLLTMKEAMATGLRGSELPDVIKEAIRGELSLDVDELADLVGNRFSGAEVPWTAGRDRGGAVSVKGFLLSETPVFRWQLEAVKEELEPFRQPGRAIRYRFP